MRRESLWIYETLSGDFEVRNKMSEQARHTISSYDAALHGLRNDVLMMSSLTDRILQSAFEALLTRNSELCDWVIAEDEEIDTLEKQVDQEAVNLLVRFHPVASDLRQVISAMKINTDLERIGDHSVTIARRAKRLNFRRLLSEVALLEPAYQQTLAIFRDSVRAFAEGDCTLAQTVKSRDRALDTLTSDIGEKLVARASADPENVPTYLDLIFVSRALERVGDHATNIAEDSFWRDQATDIRHTKGRNEIAIS
jgi:phosphate transport system protein